MDDLIKAIFSAPIATLLIVAGVGFLAIAVQIILSCFAMKLYFARHGESAANRLHIISNRGERLRRAKRYRDGLAAHDRESARILTEQNSIP